MLADASKSSLEDALKTWDVCMQVKAFVADGGISDAATERVREVFGEEPVVVVAEGDLQELILTPNLGRLLRLEGCLSGKVPKGAKPIPGPCTELAKLNPVQFLAGPGTFLNEAVIQIDEQLQRLAATVPPDQLRSTHDLLIAAWRFAAGAVEGRQKAITAGDLPTAWQASSAAAGAILLLTRAQGEMRDALKPPVFHE